MTTELDYLLHEKKCAQMMLDGTTNPINKIDAEAQLRIANEKLDNFYNWTSSHNQNQSEYDFGNGYKIIHNKKLNMCYKTKDGEVIDSFSAHILLCEFEQIQINFMKAIQ